MQPNEQTEQTKYRQTQRESRLTAGGGGLRVEGLSKKEKGLMNMDNCVVIAGYSGMGVRGLNGFGEKIQ